MPCWTYRGFDRDGTCRIECRIISDLHKICPVQVECLTGQAGCERADASGRGIEPPDPVAAMLRKALMIPTTVPNKPMNGAVEPIVARLETPRFNSAWTIAEARSRARREASMVSPEISVDPW